MRARSCRSPQFGHSGIWSSACSATWKPQLCAAERSRSGERAGESTVCNSPLLGSASSASVPAAFRPGPSGLPRELVSDLLTYPNPLDENSCSLRAKLPAMQPRGFSGAAPDKASDRPRTRCCTSRRLARRMRGPHATVSVTRTVDAPRERVFELPVATSRTTPSSPTTTCTTSGSSGSSRAGIGAAASYRIALPARRASGASRRSPSSSRRTGSCSRGSSGRLGRDQDARRVPADPGRPRHDARRIQFETEPATPVDRLKEALGMRGWLAAQSRRALRRLATCLEEGEPSAHAVRPAAAG